MKMGLLARISLCAMLAAVVNPVLAASDTDANMITLKNFDFIPMKLAVPVGSTVRWKNLDAEPHTVVSDQGLFRSGGLDQNDTFEFKFDRPGTYRFICSIHPTMMGTIVVK